MRRGSRVLMALIGLAGAALVAAGAAGGAEGGVRMSPAGAGAPIESGRAEIATVDPASVRQAHWTRDEQGNLYLLGAGSGESELEAADECRLKSGQGYRLTLRGYRQEGTASGWKTLFIALKDAQGNQYGFSVGKPDESFIFCQTPAWKPLGYNFKFKPPLTLQLQRREGKVELLAGDKLIFAVDEPAGGALDRLSLRLARQSGRESVLADIAAIQIVPAQTPPPAPKAAPTGAGAYFPVPEQISPPPAIPASSEFPRIVVMHNMWWSGPSSPRFIPGGFSDKPNVPAGDYENAPLIPSAARDAEGKALEYPRGMLIQLFRDAEAAGIDALVYDCFSDGVGDFASLFNVAEAARLSGTRVKILPATDRMPQDGPDFLRNYWLFRDPASGKYLHDHPNVLRVGACPVVLEYDNRVTPEQWAERFRRVQAVGGNCFVIAHGEDGINSAVRGLLSEKVRDHIAFAPGTYLFGGGGGKAFDAPDAIESLVKMAKSFDPPKIVGDGIGPGYIGVTRVGNVLDPRGTQILRWGWMRDITASPDFVHLPTGNDYSEATEQECSANSSFTFIDLTRYFGARWRTGQWPALEKPEAFLSYRATLALRERGEFELVLLRPDVSGQETAAQIARRFRATCRVRLSDGQVSELPAAQPEAEMGHVVWRFWTREGFGKPGCGVPEVRIEADGQTVDLPDGPAAAFGIMNDGEELARKWLDVPLHRIRPGVRAQLVVTGSPENLYPRTLRVQGLPDQQAAGGVLMRNGIHSLWYTLPGETLQKGFVERFYAGPGYGPMRYHDGWKKRRVVDQTDRYTAVVRMQDDTLVYPQPAILPAPCVDPATAMDLMIPAPLDQLGVPVDGGLAKQWQPTQDVLVDRGPWGRDVALPPAGDPTRPAIGRDGPDGPWYLRFDGNKNQVKTGVLSMPPGPLTVDLTVRFRRTDRAQIIFDQWGNAMGIGLSAKGSLVAVRVNQKRKLDVVQGVKTLEPERWYRITGVYDGREMRLYVDGRPDGEPVASHGLRTDENTVIGGSSGTLAVLSGIQERVQGPFGGDLSRVRVLQRSWSAAEVQAEHKRSAMAGRS